MARRPDVLRNSELLVLRREFDAVEIFAAAAVFMQEEISANHDVEAEVRENELDVALVARGLRNFFSLPLFQSLHSILAVLERFRHRVRYDVNKSDETDYLLAVVRQIVEKNNNILAITEAHLSAATPTVQACVMLMQNISRCLFAIGVRGGPLNDSFMHFADLMNANPLHIAH